MKFHHRPHVVLLGLVLAGLAAYVSSLGDLAKTVPLFISLFGLMFVVYLGAVVSLARLDSPGRGMLLYVFVIAAVCRLVFLSAAPSLSTDICRYLWEGRVIEAGYNPFALPPSAPDLEFLRDENYARINHKHLETIYPPVAQGVFYLGAVLRPDLTTQKSLFALFDMGTMAVVLLLLLKKRRNPALCAIYGWSPLVVFEFSHSGHVDSVGIFFLMLAIYLWHVGPAKRADASSIVALSFSFLSKYVSVLLLPFYLFKKREALWLVLFAAIVALGYLPFVGASGKLVSSLRVYGQNWEFNSALYGALSMVFNGSEWVRIGLFAFVILFSIYQGRAQSDLLRCAYGVIACSLLFTPTFYPWYLCWLVPFLCFYPNRAWIYLTGAIVASYWVLVRFDAAGVWNPGWAVLAIEYVPFFALLAWDAYRISRKRRKTWV